MTIQDLTTKPLEEIERMWREKVQGWSVEYYAGGEYGVEYGKGFVLRNSGGAIYTFECASESEAWAHCPPVAEKEWLNELNRLLEKDYIEITVSKSLGVQVWVGTYGYNLAESEDFFSIAFGEDMLKRAGLIASIYSQDKGCYQ